MNPILQDASAATAAQGNLAQGVAGTAVVGNATASSENGATGQAAGASAMQDKSAFGDILGQVQSLLAELAPANAQQAASASHAERPLPSMTPPAANGGAEPAAALPADVESSLPAFMRGRRTGFRPRCCGASSRADVSDVYAECGDAGCAAGAPGGGNG
jgi:hypothetical protein